MLAFGRILGLAAGEAEGEVGRILGLAASQRARKTPDGIWENDGDHDGDDVMDTTEPGEVQLEIDRYLRAAASAGLVNDPGNWSYVPTSYAQRTTGEACARPGHTGGGAWATGDEPAVWLRAVIPRPTLLIVHRVGSFPGHRPSSGSP